MFIYFSVESSSCALSQQSSQDWFEKNKSPKDKFNEAFQRLTDNQFEPLKSQLNTPWKNLGKSARYYYSNKAKEAVLIVLGIIAPGQEEIVLSEISSKRSTKLDTDEITQQLIEAYHATSDKKTQLQILSLFVTNFTKQQLIQLIPSLTYSKIDSARKHAAVTGPGQMLNPPKVYRVRLSKPKSLHFLEYVAMPSISQVLGIWFSAASIVKWRKDEDSKSDKECSQCKNN